MFVAQTKATTSRLRHCPLCGYELTGSPDRHVCPECAFEYDRAMRVFRPTAATKRANAFGVLFCFTLLCWGYFAFSGNLRILMVSSYLLCVVRSYLAYLRQWKNVAIVGPDGIELFNHKGTVGHYDWRDIDSITISRLNGMVKIRAENQDRPLKSFWYTFLGSFDQSQQFATAAEAARKSYSVERPMSQ